MVSAISLGAELRDLRAVDNCEGVGWEKKSATGTSQSLHTRKAYV